MDNLKLFVHGKAIEICTSTREGLPFVATPYMEVLIKGCLAEAQSRYPITICHLVVMANHIHILAVVQAPQAVPEFMRHFKTELAHSLNRLLGRTGNLFEEGYFSAPILSPEKFLDRMLYLYSNPAKDNCVDSISQYPGINSYRSLLGGSSSERCKRIPRDAIPPLPLKNLSLHEQQRFAEELLDAEDAEEHVLSYEPWAWLSCYSEMRDPNFQTILTNFLSTLFEREKELAAERKTQPMGPDKLRRQDPRKAFKPQREGVRTICLSHCPEQRKKFVQWFKTEQAAARHVFQKWKQGDFSQLPPPGFFAPGGAFLASLLAFALPV
jgi:REP element-mobilizing transposase RayT